MQYLVYGLLSLLFSILLSVSSNLEALIGGAVPNLSLLLIIFVALARGPLLALLLASISGIVFDVTSVLPLGFHVFVYATLGFLIGKFRAVLVVDKVIGPILLCMAAFVLGNLLGFGLSAIFGLRAILFSLSSILEMIYSAIFAPLFYLLVNFLESLLRRRPGGNFK